MDVKLMNNKISLNSGSFSDFVKKTLEESQVKTASVKEEVVEKTAEADEGESSGQPEAEAKLVNEPEKEDGQTGGADNSEAETSGQPQAEAKLVNQPKVEAEGEKEVKEAESGKCEKCGCDPCECEEEKEASAEAEVKKAEVDDSEEEAEEVEEEETEKEAKSLEFIKIAKMTPETKDMLFTYWKQLYPEEYARAMVEEQ